MSPLLKGRKNIGKNIDELKADNKKKGKARGANGKPRSMKQIKAIALNVALGSKKTKFQKAVASSKMKKVKGASMSMKKMTDKEMSKKMEMMKKAKKI